MSSPEHGQPQSNRPSEEKPPVFIISDPDADAGSESGQEAGPAGAATSTAERPAPQSQPQHNTADSTSQPAQTATAAPAAAAKVRPAAPQPAPGSFMSEEEFIESMKGGRNSLAMVVIAVTGLALAGFHGYTGYQAAETLGALVACVFATVGLGFSIIFTFVVAKLIGAMFGEDYGGTGELLMKVVAFCMAFETVMVGLGIVLGPFFALILVLPVLIGLAVWLIGMDALQALVFALLSAAIKFMLLMMLAGMAMGAVMSGAAG